MRMTQDDRLCIPVPLFHSFGSIAGTLLCLINGSTMVPLEHLVGDDKAISSLAGCLVRSYASQIIRTRQDEVCRIQLYLKG